MFRRVVATVVALFLWALPVLSQENPRPNFVLLLADDQGWGETSYNHHPTLQTPNIDALARAGMTLTRFYASAPNCSPTRASLLTGRSPDRTGVLDHGYRLRTEETTIAETLSAQGYATGHFGKWHLNGLRGPGVPIFAEDPFGPGSAGFQSWLSASNYFDDNPVLSRNGVFVNLKGESSEAITAEAIAFMRDSAEAGQPFFAAVWYASPHLPWKSVYADGPVAGKVEGALRAHHGEIVGLDNSVGMVRDFLRESGLAENTLLWFQSDNGGIRKAGPGVVGDLRGFKASLYEGGIRVPSAVEWPGVIPSGQVSAVPVASVDFLPTVSALAGIPASAYPAPLDGENVMPLFSGVPFNRANPLYFRHKGWLAAIDGETKLIVPDLSKPKVELYDLASDHSEKTDLSLKDPATATGLYKRAMAWSATVDDSLAGRDYANGDGTVVAPVGFFKAPIYAPLARIYDKPEKGR